MLKLENENMNLFQLVLLLSGYRVNKAKKHLLSIQEEIASIGVAKYQEKKKWEIYKFHIQNNLKYSKYQEQEAKNWEDILPLRKGDYQEGLIAWLSEQYQYKKTYVSSTSGSSGHPFWFAKNKYCHALTWASVFDLYKKAGIKFNDLEARFYGIPLSGTSRIMEKTKDLIMKRVRFPVFDMSDQVLSKYLDQFRQKKFIYIYGYSSALVLFARYCISKKIVLKEICPTLQLCIYTSETAGEEDIKLLRQAFNVGIRSEYGASEIGIISFEDADGVFQVDDRLVYIEEYEKDDGTKTTLITSLYNKAFPIIRYDIGDIVSLNRDENGTTICQIEGRTNDVVILPGGKKAAGLTFYYISRSLLEKSGSLKEFIIRQKAIDHFVFEIVSLEPLSDEDIKLIKKETARYLMPNLKLDFIYKDSIPRLKNGKIKHFISEIDI